MISIKVTQKTKEKIDQTQAELLLSHRKKITQAELLERVVMKTLGDPAFVQTLAGEDSNEEALPPVHGHKKGKPVEIHIIQRSKGKILMFPEEWDD